MLVSSQVTLAAMLCELPEELLLCLLEFALVYGDRACFYLSRSYYNRYNLSLLSDRLIILFWYIQTQLQTDQS